MNLVRKSCPVSDEMWEKWLKLPLMMTSYKKTIRGTHPQSNGLVENGVKMMKALIKKALHSNSDPYLTLLNYRDAPLKHGKSPAELLFNRKLRTRLPVFLDQGTYKVSLAKRKNKCNQKRH